MTDQNLNNRGAGSFSGMGTAQPSTLATNAVLRNTYMLLGLTLGFSALVAYAAMVMGAPRLGMIPLLIGFFGLLFLVNRTANSAWGLLSVFLFTGFMGFTAGPVLAFYMQTAAGTSLRLVSLCGDHQKRLQLLRRLYCRGLLRVDGRGIGELVV